MSSTPNLDESLAWLNYCLGESVAAMAAVQEDALGAMKRMRAAGGDACATGQVHLYHEICESAARIITIKGRAARWGRVMKPEGCQPGPSGQQMEKP